MRQLIAECLITLGIATAVLVNSGCAQLSPQTVNLSPDIQMENRITGSGSVELTVMDNRASHTIGIRGGAYAATSTITATRPPEQVIEKLALQVMSDAGLEVTTTFADKQMQIRLEGLDYKTEKYKAGIKRTTVNARISIEVSDGKTVFKNTYQSSLYQDTVGYPGETKNEEMLNSVLSNVLNRMFSDPELSAFLKQ